MSQKIAKKLNQLTELLDKIDEARAINSDDPETWDPDVLYELAENCQEMIRLLEGKLSKAKDEFGEPLVIEEGLCSLVDEWAEKQEGEEESNDYD